MYDGANTRPIHARISRQPHAYAIKDVERRSVPPVLGSSQLMIHHPLAGFDMKHEQCLSVSLSIVPVDEGK